METYVIILSKTFPTTHPRKGEETNFRKSMENALKGKLNNCWEMFKKHTLRGNYALWEKRFEKINAGKACLSIRQWTGKPYNSPQEEICVLTKEDGIGLQRLNFYRGTMPDALFYPSVDGKPVDCTEMANNDGLTLGSWLEWFKKADLSQPMAIIHFTPFRYG